MTVPSDGTSSPATSNNQKTVGNDQVNSRNELLMEVLSQFEKRVSAQRDKNVECSQRQLDSNNGVAFDWGKLPRIGTVHSVRGIVGLERVNTSPEVGSKESSSEAPLSRMGRINMTELARLILNGTFDNFLNGSSPENQSDGNPKTTASSLDSAAQGKEKDSNQVSRVERQVFDSRVGSSSQNMAVNSVPANDSYSYRENRQLETTANQMVPSFNQPNANLSASGSFVLQSNRGRNYNTISQYLTTSGRHNFQSKQRTSYTTNNGNLTAAGCYGTMSNQRTSNNVNAGNLTANGSYVLQSNQRASYNPGTSNRTASGSHDRQSNQRTSHNTNFSHQNVSHMTHGQTPGVYGRTPVRSSYPRSLCSAPSTPTINSSSCYVGRHLTSIPRGLSYHPAGVSANRDYRFLHPHNQNLQFMNRAVRTARVEPLSNQTNIVQPLPRATSANTSNTSTSSTATASSPGNDLAKNSEHDASSCLDCKLLGSCPIKKASEKEKELKDSSDEEPELVITKVTTKEAERGPIERIDVDEWVSSSESLSESVKVKQEALDKENVALNHEENDSEINNIVNQMRLMAERLLTEDGVLDLGTTAHRNEQNPIDLNSDSISIQDSVDDSNAVDRPQVAVSEIGSAQPTSEATERGVQDGTLESSTTVSQEAACEILEESNAVRNRTSEVIATNELTSSEVTEKSIIEDRVSMDTQFASEVTEESIIREHVTEDITMVTQSASDVTAKSIAQDPVIMQAQTPPEVIEETFVQENVTKDNTMNTQLASEVTQESIAQDRVTKDVDIQPASESIEENFNQGHITDDMNVDRQTACGVADADQDAGATKTSGVNETSAATVGHDNRPLFSLMKKIKSLERCIGFLKQRANSDSGSAESEYDKGDRNYQKYVSMEGGELDDQENDETVMNTESIGNSGTIRTINQQTHRIPEMSLRDKEAMENLERQLKENQEKLKFQNDVGMRRRYLEERLFMLKKIERISQKYELMSLHDRGAINKLEKALERNQEKLKNQNVEWIRKNCLKARLIIFKKIERIRRKYGLPPEELASFINEDLESRNEDNLITMESFEAEAATEANTVPPVVGNDVPLGAVPEQENVYESANKNAADSLQMSNTSAENQKTQRLSSETPNEEAEEVTSEEESTLETLGTDNEVDIEEQDPVSYRERPLMADPSTNNVVLGNVVIKSEGIQHSDVENAFTLEDAIKALVEKPQDQQEETSGGKPTTRPSSPKNHLEGSSPLQNKNLENRTRFSLPDRREQDQSDRSILEKTTTDLSTDILPLMNCDEIVERTRVTDCEAQPNQLPDIQDLSNEITISVTDRAVQTERNHDPRKKCIRCLSTDQCGESANIANGVAESPASKNMVRKEKRKLDTRDEHELIKKEKIDADQENTPQGEKNYNIWDFIKKYSH